MKPAILSTQARKEFLEVLDWISKNNPTAALALKNVVQKAARNLGEYPFSGKEQPDLASPPVRFLALSGFPYVIVYDAALKPPVILRILHGARYLPEILDDL